MVEVRNSVNQYELTIIVPATAESVASLKEVIKKLITAFKGKIIEEMDWGERSLAYAIAKYDKGFYLHFLVELPQAAVNDLEKKVRQQKGIIRSLLVKKQ